MSNLNQIDDEMSEVRLDLENSKTTDTTYTSKSKRINLIENNPDHDDHEEANEIEMTEKYLESKFTFLDNEDDDIVKDAIHYVKKYYKPSRTCLINYFFKRLPFADWIRTYDFRHDLFKDLVAGLTVKILYKKFK